MLETGRTGRSGRVRGGRKVVEYDQYTLYKGLEIPLNPVSSNHSVMLIKISKMGK